ncbi:MAG: arginine--tRNA ligase [Flavobacteriales bacterium]|nr:arginine--tRNA ligase [Flavobacteriales bacterium]|tara:strand:- start:129 stop:1907 length:1779 start_codon:yes stop_codon:yes gene_type:complete
MIFDKHINDISSLVLKYFKNSKIDNTHVQLQKTRKEFTGDWTIVIFPLLKYSNESIQSTANNLGIHLKDHLNYITSFNIVKGFLNLEFSDQFWFDALNFSFLKNFEINKSREQNIVIEFSSPNTNKPLHLGHLRNILLGDAMANILRTDGYNVSKVQVINDRGIHICKSMLAWLKFGNNETPDSTNMKGDFFVGKYYVLFEQKYQLEQKELIDSGVSKDQAKLKSVLLSEAKNMLLKWEAGDESVMELWEKMNSWVYAGFEETYKKLGVTFDKNYYESQTYLIGKKNVLKGIDKQVFYSEKDASVWIDLSDYGLDKKILLRSDGTAVYITQDIGTAILRYDDFQFHKMIYTVGNEQNYHFEVLFKILEKMGLQWSDNLFHLSYGMVSLPDGKMKSREGNVVDIDELIFDVRQKAKLIIQDSNKFNSSQENANSIDELSEVIGDAALKYFILKTDAKKNMLFNTEESIDFNGHTGPFIQYTYARIQSILKSAKKWNRVCHVDRILLPEEKNLIQIIIDYPSVINNSATNLNPSLFANYLYNLAKNYNHFYQKHRILGLENKIDMDFRITISEKVSILISCGMNLLGVNVPKKM